MPAPAHFFPPDADPRVGLVEMVAAAERLLALDYEDAFREGDVFREGPLVQLEPLVRAELVPPAALELLAGACAAWGSPKRYALRPYWDYSFGLGDREVVADGFDPGKRLVGAPNIVRAAALDEACAALADAEKLAADRAENRALSTLAHSRVQKARFEIARLTGQLVRRPPPPLLVRAAARAAVLGAGDQFWDEWQSDRPALYEREARGVAWRAMRLATDAFAGGSLEAAAELRAMLPGAPCWLAHLVECADAVVGEGEPPRAMPEEPMLQTTEILASSRRAISGERLEAARRAWRALREPRPVRSFLPEMPMGDPELERDLDLEEAHVRATHGPFFDLRVPYDTGAALMQVGWPLLVGFRQLYGLSLVRESIDDIGQWLADGGVSA